MSLLYVRRIIGVSVEVKHEYSRHHFEISVAMQELCVVRKVENRMCWNVFEACTPQRNATLELLQANFRDGITQTFTMFRTLWLHSHLIALVIFC